MSGVAKLPKPVRSVCAVVGRYGAPADNQSISLAASLGVEEAILVERFIIENGADQIRTVDAFWQVPIGKESSAYQIMPSVSQGIGDVTGWTMLLVLIRLLMSDALIIALTTRRLDDLLLNSS